MTIIQRMLELSEAALKDILRGPFEYTPKGSKKRKKIQLGTAYNKKSHEAHTDAVREVDRLMGTKGKKKTESGKGSKVPYDKITLMPDFIAKMVCEQPYTGSEWSDRARHSTAEVEEKRKSMTPEQVREFAKLCDRRCRDAYNDGADWMMKIAKAKGNKGRDELYKWVTHWMTAYLKDPEDFRRKVKKHSDDVPALTPGKVETYTKPNGKLGWRTTGGTPIEAIATPLVPKKNMAIADTIIKAYREGDEKALNDLLSSPSATTDVVKLAASGLGIRFLRNKSKTVQYLKKSLQDYNKQLNRT